MDKNKLRKNIKKLEILAKKNVSEFLAGNYHSVFKGKGIEFHDVKEYMYGDDVKSIDWNVTARSQKVYVKNFVEERDLTVILAIDISASENFGTKVMSKKDMILNLSSMLAFSALGNKDKVGLLTFSDKIELFVPPKKSKNHALKIISLIEELEEQSGKGTDICTALEHLNNT